MPEKFKRAQYKFCEHEFNSAQSANFVSTNLKTSVHVVERPASKFSCRPEVFPVNYSLAHFLDHILSFFIPIISVILAKMFKKLHEIVFTSFRLWHKIGNLGSGINRSESLGNTNLEYHLYIIIIKYKTL